MKSFYEKYYKAGLKLILIACIFLFVYALFNYLIPFFAPFVIGIVIAFLNEPLIRLLEKRTKLSRRIAAAISLLVTLSIFGGIIVVGFLKIYNELVVLQNNLTVYIDHFTKQLSGFFDKIMVYYNNLPSGISGAVDENLKSLATKSQSLIEPIVKYLIGTITSLPKVTIFLIATFLSSYFISSDRKIIRGFVYRQFPESWSKNFTGIKSHTFTAIFSYFKAILMLMGITFIEVTIGLLFIRADYVLLMGLIVALSDVIPVLGTGIVMIPWISWNLITGNINMAIGLTVIYVIGVVVRQILEPKIVGDQIGLHPLATLLAMYIGLSVFGFLGLFIGPISLIIVKNLQTSGIIHIWND